VTQEGVKEVLGRAGRRVAYHLLKAAAEGLKAVEALIEEIGDTRDDDPDEPDTQRIRIE
jgi:hypothetical protein